MKRLSMLGALSAMMLLGVLSMTSGSASASVLCSNYALNYNCPTENTYPVGTEIKARLGYPGPATLATEKDAEPYEPAITDVTCAQGIMRFSVENAGNFYEDVELGLLALAFSSCDHGPLTLITGSSAQIGWNVGAHSGETYQFEPIIQNKSWIFGIQCKYKIVGPARISGPLDNEWGQTLIEFDDAEAEHITKLCPETMYFSATFLVEEPTPIYVEQY